MAWHQTTVTIGAAATQVTDTRTSCLQVIFQADDGNSNASFVGTSSVATTNGYRLTNSSTTPGTLTVGPFSNGAPIELSEFYIAGTQSEKVNVFYVGY